MPIVRCPLPTNRRSENSVKIIMGVENQMLPSQTKHRNCIFGFELLQSSKTPDPCSLKANTQSENSVPNCYKRWKAYAPTNIRSAHSVSNCHHRPKITRELRSAKSVSILLQTSKTWCQKPTLEVQIRFKIVKNVENECPLPTNTRSANSVPKWTKMLWIEFQNLIV